MLRNATLSAVEYVALSSLSAEVDSDGQSGQKSVSWLSGWDRPQLQIWNFDEAEAVQPDLEKDLYVARRQGASGPEVVYLPLSAAAPSV